MKIHILERLTLILFLFTPLTNVQAKEVINLWPENVPDQKEAKAADVISDNTDKNTIRISQVTNPTITLYPANPLKKNGAAVIVFPGGGYRVLASGHEGAEIAESFSEKGYTVFVLHYRVPKNPAGALQDALRAIRYVRGNRSRWAVEENKIGVIGFSAGGNLAVRASTRYKENLYPPVDKLESISARPDFSILIYPAYLDQGKDKTLTPEIILTKNTPPMFLFVAADDPYANSTLVMGSALRLTKIPFELHILPKGGHGFGMRKKNYAGSKWPALCENWLQYTLFNKP